jgi:hypothetical protein
MPRNASAKAVGAANLDPMIQEIQQVSGVLDSALVWINGSAARQQAAIDKAIADGATKEQLAGIQAVLDEQKAKADAIAAAIAANA